MSNVWFLALPNKIWHYLLKTVYNGQITWEYSFYNSKYLLSCLIHYLLLLNKITPKLCDFKKQPFTCVWFCGCVYWTRLPCIVLLLVLFGPTSVDTAFWWMHQLGCPEWPHAQVWGLVLAVSWASLSMCSFIWLTLYDDLTEAQMEAAVPHSVGVKKLPSQPRFRIWGNRLHLLVGGVTKNLWSFLMHCRLLLLNMYHKKSLITCVDL